MHVLCLYECMCGIQILQRRSAETSERRYGAYQVAIGYSSLYVVYML